MTTRNRSLVASDGGSPPLAPGSAAGTYAPGVDSVELRRVCGIVRRRWWLMISIALLVLGAGMVYTSMQRPLYEATAMMAVPMDRPMSSSSDDMGLLSDLLALAKSRSVAGMAKVLQSADLIHSVSQRLGARELAEGFGNGAAARGMIPAWALTYETSKESDVIAVTARAFSPTVAAHLANTVVDTYVEREKGYAVRAARQGREFVAKELESVRGKLDSAQKRLADFRRKTKLVAVDSQVGKLVDSAVSLQAEQDKASVELASTQRQTQVLQRQLASEGNEIQESTSIQLSPEYQQALSDLARLNAVRANMIQEYVPESVEVRKIDDEIAEIKGHMKKIAETVVASRVSARNPTLNSYLGSIVNGAVVSARKRALERMVAQRDMDIRKLPDQQHTHADLERNVHALENTFQMLSSKYYALLINENSTFPNAICAAAARPSQTAGYPNSPRNAVIFLLLGLMVATAVVMLMERFDSRIRSENTVTSLIGEAPLAIIPDVKGIRRANLQLDAVNPDSAFVEAFRILYNAIRFSPSKRHLRILAVTSPGRSEGKSTTSVNLAVTAAMSGRKVLIVDCDLRRPSLHHCTRGNGSIGFTNLVEGTVSADEAVAPTRVKNLYCLPRGPRPDRPAGFLDSDDARKTIESLSQDYDMVILDCPPCAGLGDMQVISSIVDGVILVVSVNQTLIASLYDTLTMLEQVDAPFVGSVINRLQVWGTSYDYYRSDDGPQGGNRSRVRSLKRATASDPTGSDQEVQPVAAASEE